MGTLLEQLRKFNKRKGARLFVPSDAYAERTITPLQLIAMAPEATTLKHLQDLTECGFGLSQRGQPEEFLSPFDVADLMSQDSIFRPFS